jgi:large subunit ribosomal protein L49
VARTPSGNLAVYELAKRGGNKKLTLLKKIEGDRAALRAALAEGLKMSEKDVKLNTLTGHLRVEVRA